jgi:hypothetical protein
LADVLRSRREVACANQPDNSDAAVAKIVIACWALERNVYAWYNCKQSCAMDDFAINCNQLQKMWQMIARSIAKDMHAHIRIDCGNVTTESSVE